MAKLFSTKTHGMLDYVTAGQLLLLPSALGWDRQVTRLVQGMGVATALYSLVTRYELGAVKLVPMPVHLGVDVASGLGFCAAAAMLSDRPTSVRATLAAIGVFEIVAGLSTETEPRGKPRARSFATTSVKDLVAPLRSLNTSR